MKRDDIDIDHFRNLLKEELSVVEKELKTVGRKNPDNPADWEAVAPDFDDADADSNVNADKIEEFESNTAILKELEIRYTAIKEALSAIDEGSYGYCKIGGEAIDNDRLEANPSALTCVEHA